jgi:hypothetical protein
VLLCCSCRGFELGVAGYVCDTPASACPEWACKGKHCQAKHDDPKWQALRAAWKAHGGAPPADGSSSAPLPAGGGSSAADDDHEPYHRHHVTRLSCDEFLDRIQQVYPREEVEPPGFPPALKLRPYQRQSLAFMLDVERSTDPALVGKRMLLQRADHGRRARYYRHSDWVPWDTPAHTHPARGGWLCDEVGSTVAALQTCSSSRSLSPLPTDGRSRPVAAVGKTAVIAALILANPAANIKPVNDADFRALLTERGTRHNFKVTVVIVNNTLLQQVHAWRVH